MAQQITLRVLLIRRLNVALLVVLRSSGLVNIEPFQCKDENLRLWSVIAKTQTLPAQAQLEKSKQENPLTVLSAHFQSSGWDVKELEERKEASL